MERKVIKTDKEFDFNLFTMEVLTVMPVDEFGKIIRFIRERNNISKEQYAVSLGVSFNVLTMLENGEMIWSDIKKVFDVKREKMIGCKKYSE